MITKVYCFAGYLQKFYKVEPEVFLAEVSRHIPDAEVTGIYPNYQEWAQGGKHGQEVDALLARLQADAAGAERIVMIGFSVGGYLAALLGNLLPATHVLAYAPPTNLREVNLGSRGKLENLDSRYTDLIDVCTGVPKMLLIADKTQKGRANSHHPRQVNRLRGIANIKIASRRGFDFENEYFPSGNFAADLKNLLLKEPKVHE